MIFIAVFVYKSIISIEVIENATGSIYLFVCVCMTAIGIKDGTSV